MLIDPERLGMCDLMQMWLSCLWRLVNGLDFFVGGSPDRIGSLRSDLEAGASHRAGIHRERLRPGGEG